MSDVHHPFQLPFIRWADVAIIRPRAPLLPRQLYDHELVYVLDGHGTISIHNEPQPARQVTVTEIPGVVAAGVQWTQAWAGRDNADGLVGAPDGGLLFAQEQPKRVSRLDANNRVSVYVENTNGAGSLALDTRVLTIGYGGVFVG